MSAAAAVNLYLPMPPWNPQLLTALWTFEDLKLSTRFQPAAKSPHPLPCLKTGMQINLIFLKPSARIPGKHPHINKDQT